MRVWHGNGTTSRLALGLDVGTTPCTVLDVFLPQGSQSWEEKGEQVTFYLVLVIPTVARDGKQCCWLPYWHIHGKNTKFEQSAPLMDADELLGMLEQARDKGYLREQVVTSA